MTDFTGYWFFSCSPKIWAVDLFLMTKKEYGTYTISPNHKDTIKPGQFGVIRVSSDTRSQKLLQGRNKLNTGVYAIVEIVGFPIMSTDDDDEFYYNKEISKEERFRVKIRYLKNLLAQPLLIKDIKNNLVINLDTKFIEGFRSATWPLSTGAFDEILKIVNINDEAFSNPKLKDANTIEEILVMESIYQNVSPQVKEVISKRIERGKISNKIKKLNDFKCQVCEAFGQNPYSFEKRNGEFYIETHHIDPVATLKVGSLGISNLITVCANHHRQFHYGNNILQINAEDFLVIIIDGQTCRIKKRKYWK